MKDRVFRVLSASVVLASFVNIGTAAAFSCKELATELMSSDKKVFHFDGKTVTALEIKEKSKISETNKALSCMYTVVLDDKSEHVAIAKAPLNNATGEREGGSSIELVDVPSR